MLDRVLQLQELAKLAIDSPATRESLARVADLIRDALSAERVALVYTVDRDFSVCSDSQCADDIGTNQMGLWLVLHQIEITGKPVAFDIEGGRVSGIIPAARTEGHEYIGCSIAAGCESGEMLIVKRSAGHLLGPAALSFIRSAAPSIVLVLDRLLAVARAERQREQMMALANAAELLIQAEHVEPVLEDLATAISRSSGYDLVTIDVYDRESRTFTVSAINRTPQVETSLGTAWRQQTGGTIYAEAVMRTLIARPEPLLVADLQNDDRIPEYGREFFKRAHIFSGAQLPVTFHDEFLGVLRLASQHPRSFPAQEVESLNGLAAQLAVALKAVEMYKSLAESERQLKRYAEELQSSMEVQHRLARTDALTGVPNRRYVDEVIKGECSRAVRHKTSLCVVLADVDKFKDVNDNHGHKAGDEALMQLADLARRSCRRGDVVGRYGGDEFLFVLPRANLAAAIRFGNRFRAQVAEHVFCLSPDATVNMRVSVGVAELDPGEAVDPLELTKEADEALYKAKARGGNATCSVRPARRAA